MLGEAVRHGDGVESPGADALGALRALHAVTRRVHASLDLATTLDAVAESVAEVAGFRVAVVNLRHGDVFHVVSVAGDEDVRDALLGTSAAKHLWEQMLGHSEDLGGLRFVDHRTGGAEQDGLFSWVPDIEPSGDLEAWHPLDALFAPLTSPSGQWIGVLSVDLPLHGRRPDAWQLEVLSLFADQAAVAIEHARMYSTLQQQEAEARHASLHDPLTGLANRTLLLTLAHELAARPASQLAVLVLDLDGFKSLNDTHGHAAGDEVLQVLARRMERSVEPDDVVARSGGDEFVIVLSDRAVADRAEALVTTLRRDLAGPVPARSGTYCLGASIGLAVGATPTSVSDLLSRADAAMYVDKATGRRP